MTAAEIEMGIFGNQVIQVAGADEVVPGQFRIRDCIDGTSNTLAFGEKSYYTFDDGEPKDWPIWAAAAENARLAITPTVWRR